MLELADLVVQHRRRRSLMSRLLGHQTAFVRTLDGVSLRIGSGETLGLIGESGSGKTTLGRAIIGLQPVAAGRITFEGRELAGLSEREYRPVRRYISMIFQDPVASLSPRKRVRTLLLEPYVIHCIGEGGERQGVDELLLAVGLDPGLADAYPHQLSGGQARRVGIARAMALGPRLVIADEPTAGLDVSVQGEVINLMMDLQDRTSVSYLFITHNLALARHLCDRLAIVYRGALCEIGPTEAIIASPAHPYTRKLLACMLATPADVAEAVPHRQIPAAGPGAETGCSFADGCDRATSRCRAVRPESIAMADGRSIRCHFPCDSGGN